MTTSITDTIIKPKIEPRLDLKEPSLFKVIYINDETTTLEFVIESLVTVFNLTPDEAEHVATRVHEEGSGVAAVLPYEIAEQKGIEVTIMARSQGFPLQIKLETD